MKTTKQLESYGNQWNKIKNNENLAEMVDDQVLEYISKKSLYKI